MNDPHPLFRNHPEYDTPAILNLFEHVKSLKRPLYVSAPMVRYSKLPFRALVRDYKCDLAYTPMILAKEFISHENARHSDFSSNAEDRPLVIQFAANNTAVFAAACKMVMPYTDAVGLNCGCPQSWACQEGYGAHLMKEPQLVADMVKDARGSCGTKFTIETKIRIHNDLKETVSFAKQLEAAGIGFLTVHGRTKSTRSSQPVDLEAIKLIKENVSIPVVANGDAFSLNDVSRIWRETGVDGVMAARGILENPALFAGHERCPWSAIERFVDYSIAYGLNFHLFRHHIELMMDNGRFWKKPEKKEFVEHTNLAQSLDWLDDRYVLRRPKEEKFGVLDSPETRKGHLVDLLRTH